MPRHQKLVLPRCGNRIKNWQSSSNMNFLTKSLLFHMVLLPHSAHYFSSLLSICVHFHINSHSLTYWYFHPNYSQSRECLYLYISLFINLLVFVYFFMEIKSVPIFSASMGCASVDSWVFIIIKFWCPFSRFFRFGFESDSFGICSMHLSYCK